MIGMVVMFVPMITVTTTSPSPHYHHHTSITPPIPSFTQTLQFILHAYDECTLSLTTAHAQDSEDSHDSFFMEDADDKAAPTLHDAEPDEKEAPSDQSDENPSDEKVLGETKPLSKEEIDKYNEKIRRSGVVYLSSLPTYMKPEKVKYLLGKYGTVQRMHLVEEDPTITRRRAKSGGSHKKKYTEGWVEFEDKRDAKQCAAMMNGQIVGGKKSGFFHDMIWNIKYLKGFKWSDLMEKLTLEKRLRADRLRVQFAKNRKADEQYLENVSRAEKKEMIEKKRKKSKKSASRVC